MSASLVGSEMCIRDSTYEYSELRPPKPRKLRPPAPRRHPRAPPTADPVSYTHLTLPTICSV
eukprot:1275988-Alexandrium_andersonii.AAC.1